MQGAKSYRGVCSLSEEANHLGVWGWADKGHVAISEGAIDLQVEARLDCCIPVLSEGFHSISRQVKVKAVCTNLRCGYLKLGKKWKEEVQD